jgi:membrane-associated phospholipid phosphatase
MDDKGFSSVLESSRVLNRGVKFNALLAWSSIDDCASINANLFKPLRFNNGAVHEGDVTETDRERIRWATAISNVTFPPIIGVLTFGLINNAVSSGFYFVVLTLLTTLVAAVAPLIILIAWGRVRAHNPDTAARAGRGYWLLVSTASYFVGTAVLLLTRAPPLIAAVMFGYGAVTLVISLINLRWKISIHTMSVTVPTTVLVFVFGPWGLLCGLLLPPVIWSRVYLKKHTIAQAIAGALVGFVFMAPILFLLLPFGSL